MDFELQLSIYANINSLSLFSTKPDEAQDGTHLYYWEMGLNTWNRVLATLEAKISLQEVANLLVHFEMQLSIYANINSLSLFSTKSDEAQDGTHPYYWEMGLNTWNRVLATLEAKISLQEVASL